MLNSLIFASVWMFAATPTNAATNPLQPLDFLVGSCWAGDFPNGMGVDTHCFERMFGDKFVRDKHVLHGKKGDYLGETIYGFEPAKKQITYWYFSSDGDIDSSSVIPVADGFDFPERHLTEPKDMTMRTHWHRIDADHYESINERKNGDVWQIEWKVQYQRVAKTKSD